MAGEIFVAKEDTLQSVLVAVNGLSAKADDIKNVVDNQPTNDTIGNYVGSSGVVKSKQTFQYYFSNQTNHYKWLNREVYQLSIPISNVDISKCIIDVKSNIGTSYNSSNSDDLQCNPVIKEATNTKIVLAIDTYKLNNGFYKIQPRLISVEVIEFY